MKTREHVNAARRKILKSSVALMAGTTANMYIPAALADLFLQSQKGEIFTPAQAAKLQAIRKVENIYIPMPDGRQLAALIQLPVDAEVSPVPAVVEYLPYRKRDIGRIDFLHQFTAMHGYACLRVDIQGTGESTGLLDDEYLKQEQDDALAMFKWLEEQPWCTGAVGMRGISWGGINALQVAALNPPQLKAIVTHGSTDDRFLEDAHYVGGSLASANFDWGVLFTSFLALPPDPAIAGEQWRETWMKRLDNIKPVAHEWTRHQSRDAFWKHGSVAQDYSKIKCAVYTVCGFVDMYVNTIARLLSNLSGPRKGHLGPHGHMFPDQSQPGPAIGFMYEEIRWWDHWLKGIDTGIMDEPMLQAYMNYNVPGQAYPDDVPGRWVAEREWPSPRLKEVRYFLNSTGLSRKQGPVSALTLEPDHRVGLANATILPFAMDSELPLDQTQDDNRSLVFDSGVLKTQMEILGRPVIKLKISADQPIARVAVRLNEVAPDGSSWIVTDGHLNLTHRNGHDNPEALIPGRIYDIDLPLNIIAHRFKPGHKIRIALSESYWPTIWPSPKPVKLTLRTGLSSIVLPVRPTGATELERVTFQEAVANPAPGITLLEPGVDISETTGDDEHSAIIRHNTISDSGLYRLDEIGTGIRVKYTRQATISKSDPGAASWHCSASLTLNRDEWNIKADTDMEITSDERTFFLKSKLVAYEKDDIIFTREWQDAIPRHLG